MPRNVYVCLMCGWLLAWLVFIGVLIVFASVMSRNVYVCLMCGWLLA